MNLSEVLLRGDFWGAIFSGVGAGTVFSRYGFRGCLEAAQKKPIKTRDGTAPKPQSYKHWVRFFSFDRFKAPTFQAEIFASTYDVV